MESKARQANTGVPVAKQPFEGQFFMYSAYCLCKTASLYQHSFLPEWRILVSVRSQGPPASLSGESGFLIWACRAALSSLKPP